MLHKMHAEHPFPPSSQEIASLVRQLVERVGAERLVYGSVRISKQTSHQRPALSGGGRYGGRTCRRARRW